MQHSIYIHDCLNNSQNQLQNNKYLFEITLKIIEYFLTSAKPHS